MNTVERIKDLKEKECIVDVLFKEVSSHICNDCGKCVFGYEGVTQLAMILKDITEKKGTSTDFALMQELCTMMENQVLCEDGVQIAQAVLTALEDYRGDMENHISKKGCRAGVCRKFMTFHILADRCNGCGECMDVCADDAILGKKRFVHVIVQDECIQCGECMETCEENAVVCAGAVKPRCPKKPVPCKKKTC